MRKPRIALPVGSSLARPEISLGYRYRRYRAPRRIKLRSLARNNATHSANTMQRNRGLIRYFLNALPTYYQRYLFSSRSCLKIDIQDVENFDTLSIFGIKELCKSINEINARSVKVSINIKIKLHR